MGSQYFQNWWMATFPGLAIFTAVLAFNFIGDGLRDVFDPQSSFREELQGEISGLSRSVSNLGSCLGTAIAGTILVANLVYRNYAAAMITLGVLGLVGLAAAWFLPATPVTEAAGDTVLPQPLSRA